MRRNEMEELTIYSSGEIDLTSVENLSTDEMKAWIIARLRGRDAIVPGDQRGGEPAYQVFVWIFEQGSEKTKTAIETAVEGILRRVLLRQHTEWSDEALRDLLMLVQDVGSDAHASIIYDAVRTESFLQEDTDVDTHYRLVQSLASMQWEGTAAFWKDQLRLDPARYCSVVFLGLLNLRVSEAASTLRDVPWEQEVVQERMSITLRSLEWRDRGQDAIREIRKILPSLPKEGQKVVADSIPKQTVRIPVGRKWSEFVWYCRERDPGIEQLAKSKLFSDLVDVEQAGVIFIVLQHHESKPLSFKRIDREYNFSQSEVRRAERKGIRKVRRLLRKYTIGEERTGGDSPQGRRTNVLRDLKEIYDGGREAA